MRDCNDILKGYRYIPDREKMDREFSGLISLGDFSTSYTTTHVVDKIVSAENFNSKMRKLLKREER